MNSNFEVFVYVLVIISLLSLFWHIFFTSYLKKKGMSNDGYDNSREKKLLRVINPGLCSTNFEFECSLELPNTDDDISEALNYIEPSKYAGDLLEKMYEQAGI